MSSLVFILTVGVSGDHDGVCNASKAGRKGIDRFDLVSEKIGWQNFDCVHYVVVYQVSTI